MPARAPGEGRHDRPRPRPRLAAIRATVTCAVDDPDPPRAPPFAVPSAGGKSVLVFDEAMPLMEHGLARMTPADWALLFPLGRRRENADAGGEEGCDAG